jgi:hypothetical protein
MSWITTHLRAQGQHEPHVKTAMWQGNKISADLGTKSQ